MVKVQRTASSDAALLNPESGVWRTVAASEMRLGATPITAQPSKYVQEKWRDEPYGQTGELAVRAARNDERLYFHLSWRDPSEDGGIHDTDQFADAAAVLFPVLEDAPLQSMGSPQQPVNAWYWRPDLEEPLSVRAQGTGTSHRANDPELHASAVRQDDAWTVVIGRTLSPSVGGDVGFVPGGKGKVAFAVWQGALQERGGLKSVTLEWQPLEIEA